MIKSYCAGRVGRVVWTGVFLMGAGGVVCHFVGLILGPGSAAISPGMHAGASLFVMFLSAGYALLGLSRLRKRFDVDTTGMRRERPWIAGGLDIRWDQVQSWGLRLVVTTNEMNDGWGGPTMTTETFHKRLEIGLNAPPWQLRCDPGFPYFDEIVDALRAHVPAKEQDLPMERV